MQPLASWVQRQRVLLPVAARTPPDSHSNGLPLAVQVVGRLYDDVGVLRMAAAIERARPWGHLWPALAEEA